MLAGRTCSTCLTSDFPGDVKAARCGVAGRLQLETVVETCIPHGLPLSTVVESGSIEEHRGGRLLVGRYP